MRCFANLLLCFVTVVNLYEGILADTDGRIVGGRPAESGEFPYQVSLRKSYNDNHFCGGSIIGRKFVLTAAHCMFYRWGGVLPPIVVSVVAGQLNINITQQTVYRNASRIIIHPEFDSRSYYKDFALIEVDNPFPIENNNLISSVELADSLVTNGTCVISGWGKESVFSEELISQELLAANVDVVPLEKCQEMYSVVNVTLDEESMLCAGHVAGETDACQGDSGGPLLCNGKLTGVISTGRGCADADFPGIYGDIFKLLDWIRENAVESTTVAPADATTELPRTSITVPPSKHPSSLQQVANFVSSLFDPNNSSGCLTILPKISVLFACIFSIKIFN